jgi:Nif-specific regulatory protein
VRSAPTKGSAAGRVETTRGNRAKAARLLDTTERIVNYKVRHYGIDAKRFKS